MKIIEVEGGRGLCIKLIMAIAACKRNASLLVSRLLLIVVAIVEECFWQRQMTAERPASGSVDRRQWPGEERVTDKLIRESFNRVKKRQCVCVYVCVESKGVKQRRERVLWTPSRFNLEGNPR